MIQEINKNTLHHYGEISIGPVEIERINQKLNTDNLNILKILDDSYYSYKFLES